MILRSEDIGKGKTIFTFTVVNGDPSTPLDDHRNKMRSRCWGYYFDRKDAEYVIEHNSTDMAELGYYQYAVLSEVGEGPMPLGDELQWYEFIWNWDVPPREHDGIVIPEFVEAKKIEKPEMYQQIYFGTI